ncbi:MAG: hypothetical protein H7Z19_08415 [Chitinophagaceae bacterium]|nr:hypothetical protein [Rubrivivax sp.]
MPTCRDCKVVIGDLDLFVSHQKTCDQKAKVVPRAAPVVPQKVFNTPDKHTLREIATEGRPNETFYLAANQSLLNLLSHEDGTTKSIAHTSFFKNMVGTILLETANREPGPGRDKIFDTLLSWEVRLFNRMSKSTQLDLLDMLWRCCYRRESPSTAASNMMDGADQVDGDKSLPSSIRRVPGTGFFARIQGGPVKDAWKRWQIGFRVDGGKDSGSRDDLSRIATEGCVALLKSPDLAVRVVKKFFHEHPASHGTDLYVGFQNRDLYNESGTCVARSLLGATAFPYRHTHNNHPGPPDAGGELQFQYLFAIRCLGELGLDTEKVQSDMGNNSLWRPGEKAFAGFKADRILGWTRLVRTGQPKSTSSVSTGWSFKFVDSKWTWLRPPGGELQSYLEAELETWEPGIQYNISETYDFQVNAS